MPLLLLALFLLGGCATTDSQTSSDLNSGGLETKAIEPASIPAFDAAEFEQVQFFERWVGGQLTEAEKKNAREGCKRDPKHHLFCPSIKAGRFFDTWHREQQALPPVSIPRVVSVPELKWTKGKIERWSKLRKEKISLLVKALEKMTREEIAKVSALARKEKKCPNNWAGAVAARLEDFANPSDADQIARLYEKAGRCSSKRSPDREHLLTRAALIHFQNKQFKETERILSKISPRDALSSRPLYWSLRANLALGKKDRAKSILGKMLSRYRFSFHSLVASQQFNRSYPTAYFQPGPSFDSRSVRFKRANVFIEEVELCQKYKQQDCAEAIAEYIFEKFRKLESPVRCYLASFATAQTQVRRLQEVVIARSDLNHRNTFELLFPRPHLNEFEMQQSTAEPALLYAVARKESQFDPKAISIAEAYGLLQLQLPTAKRFQSSVERDALFDPKTNVSIAALYLKDLKERYSGNLILALAAYNAGEDAVKRWTGRYPSGDPILFLDLIPYRETRDYVGLVLANFYWYRRLYYGDDSPLAKVMPESTIAVQKLD